MYYTFRSELCFERMQYICWGSDIEWLTDVSRDVRWSDVDEYLAQSRKVIRYGLRPIGQGVRKIVEKLNRGDQINDDEKLTYGTDTRNFASEEVGSNPIVDVTNQLFGRTFLVQRTPYPECLRCSHVMEFLAAMTESKVLGIDFIPPGTQVIFFGCAACGTIDAQHVI